MPRDKSAHASYGAPLPSFRYGHSAARQKAIYIHSWDHIVSSGPVEAITTTMEAHQLFPRHGGMDMGSSSTNATCTTEVFITLTDT